MRDVNYKHFLDKGTTILIYLSLLTASFSVLFPREYHTLAHIAMGTLIGTGILRLFFFSLPDVRRRMLNLIGPVGMYLVLVAGLYTNPEPDWFRISFIKNHFVLAGFAIGMLLMPRFKSKDLILTGLPFALFVTGIALMAVQRYYNFEQYVHWENGIEKLDVLSAAFIPFGIWHHTLGVFMTIGMLIFYYSWEYNKAHLNRYVSLMLWVLILFLFMLQHYISSRVGLITAYVLLFYVINSNIKSKKKYLLYVGFLLTGVIAYVVVDTFNNRVKNSMEAVMNPLNYKEGEINNISGRVLGFKVGWEIVKKKPLTGISYSMFDSDNQYFIDFYNSIGINHSDLYFRPHNQFLFYAVLFGVPLTIIFMLLYTLHFIISSNQMLYFFYFIFTFYCFTEIPLIYGEIFYPFSYFISLLAHIINDKKYA